MLKCPADSRLMCFPWSQLLEEASVTVKSFGKVKTSEIGHPGVGQHQGELS